MADIDDNFMEDSPLDRYVREKLATEQTYDRDYIGLCRVHNVVPVAKDFFVDKYIGILARADTLREKAELYQEQDKLHLLEMLEEKGVPDPLDLDLLERFPAALYETLNSFAEGVICLFIIFQDKEIIICPAFFGEKQDEAQLPDGVGGIF